MRARRAIRLPVRMLVAVCICVGVSLSSKSSLADKVPGGSPWHGYYYSYDMALVEIYLGGAKSPIKRTKDWFFYLPRAMIRFADPYQQPAYPRIPDHIETRGVKIEIVYPTGEPLSIALREAAKHSGRSEDELAKSTDFRTRIYSVTLHPRPYFADDENHITRPWSPLRPESKKYYKYKNLFDGIQVYKWLARIYYIANENDEFYYAECSIKTNPIQWCDYRIRINEKLFASAHFVSLVHHGGRAFANERVRALRRALCKYMTCEMVTEDGSLIREGRK